jgi:hypothetical protein
MFSEEVTLIPLLSGCKSFVLRFDLRMLSNVEVKEQYQVKILIAFRNVDDNADINRACENITENIKTSATESLGYFELK